jgi:hypothetical protein
MVSSGLLRRVALVRTDVSEEPGASFIRETKICELGTTQAATINRRTLRRNTKVYLVFLRSLRRFLQEPHGVTTQKTPFFIASCYTDRTYIRKLCIYFVVISLYLLSQVGIFLKIFIHSFPPPYKLNTFLLNLRRCISAQLFGLFCSITIL